MSLDLRERSSRIHFIHYEAEVRDHDEISREVTLAQVLEGADDGQEQEASLILCGSGGFDVVSDRLCRSSRHLLAAFSNPAANSTKEAARGYHPPLFSGIF
jgi:hypothetical protein